MYCRFESGIHPRENVVDVVCTLKDHIESLDDHRQLLETVRSEMFHSEISHVSPVTTQLQNLEKSGI